MTHRDRRLSRKAQHGFTLIELLVVVLIIGILAAIAIPNYFQVLERTRFAEAKDFIGNVKSAEIAALHRGAYIIGPANIVSLDASFPTVDQFYGMKYFSVSGLADNPCANNDPGYTLTVKRMATQDDGKTVNAIPGKYGGNATGYSVTYNSCNEGTATNPLTCDNTNCVTDFL